MKRAALYIRVSTDEQAMHGYSLDAQREALTKYANDRQMYIVDYYVDDGYSARKKYTTRPACLRMLEDIEAGKIDIILFIKLDRWFRNVKEYYRVQDILDTHHVNWIATQEDYDTTTSGGQLSVNVMLAVAQNESDRTSERIKFAFDTKLKRKEYLCGKTPVGYRLENKRLVIDEEKAIAVRAMFDFYELKQSKYAAMKFLQSEYGIIITQRHISRMLSNTIFKGEYRGVQNFCEPIVSEEQFQRIAYISQNNSVKNTPTGNIYLFSSIITCEGCGRKMAALHSSTATAEHYYYRCNHHTLRGQCSQSKHIKESDVEKFLIDNICGMAENFITDFESNQKNSIEKKKTQKQSIVLKLERLRELYIEGHMTKQEYSSEFVRLKEKLQEFEEIPYSNLDIEKIKGLTKTDLLDKYDKLLRQQKRDFWRNSITGVSVKLDGSFSIFLD